MPVGKAVAKRQLARMAEFPGAPKTPMGWAECISALAEVAPDADRCEAIARRLSRTLTRFPLPVDITHAAEAERNARERVWSPSAQPRCRDCLDMGWLLVPGGYDTVAKRCHCMPPLESTA